MASNKVINEPSTHEDAVEEYIASLDEQTASDARTLIAVMQQVSGHPPKLWNVGTVGFDTYHYKYDSGREGDCHAIGFYPRKDKLTFYFMDGTVRYPELLSRLGKHKTSKACLYIKRLSDVALPVLEQMLRESYSYIKSQDGQMRRV